MPKIELLCAADAARIDAFIAAQSELSRSAAAKLCEAGAVTVDGRAVAKKDGVRAGQQVIIDLPEPEPTDAQAEDIPLDIVYEDGDLLVVDKPKGMCVHPAPGHSGGTLVNALLGYCGDSLSGIGGVIRPGIVHRIDKDTSGLLIVAKNDRAHNCLAAQIKEHSFTREYEAVVYGNVKADEGTVDAPIGRHETRRKQMCVTAKNSRSAVTHYRVLERFGDYTYLRLRLQTGRTHQIRVHMAHIGHPVAGDPVYGPRKVIAELGGQCLHARHIGFIHPDGRELEFESKLPDYFERFLAKLRNRQGL